MKGTPFPARPIDVVALTVQEFTFNLEMNRAPSIDTVCRRFVDDANRAVVWLIRYDALKAWCARADLADWLDVDSSLSRDAHEVAASFDLNDRWEFDVERFRAAVDLAGCHKPGQPR